MPDTAPNWFGDELDWLAFRRAAQHRRLTPALAETAYLLVLGLSTPEAAEFVERSESAIKARLKRLRESYGASRAGVIRLVLRDYTRFLRASANRPRR